MGQGHWAFSGRSELASVVCGCEGEAVVDWLALRDLFIGASPSMLGHLSQGRP